MSRSTDAHDPSVRETDTSHRGFRDGERKRKVTSPFPC